MLKPYFPDSFRRIVNRDDLGRPSTGVHKMAKVADIKYQLRNLPLGEHRLIEIIKIIIQADPYQKEGLFDNSPFGRENNQPYDDKFYPDEITKVLRDIFPNGLEDLYIDITYQRVLKLKKIVEKLYEDALAGDN